MKILAALALSTLVLSGAVKADPIWSYTFAEESTPGAEQFGFVIWHDGPIVPIGGIYFAPGFPELHYCSAGRLFCAGAGFEVHPTGLEAIFSRQFSLNPIVPLPPDTMLFPGSAFDQTGTFTVNFAGGIYRLKISDDPADLAPEPATWVLLSFAMIGLCCVSRLRSPSAPLGTLL